MSRSVLCAIDITRPDDEKPVLIQAARLAALDGARLDILTVLPDVGSPIVGLYLQDHDVATAKEKASDLLNKTITAALGDAPQTELRRLVATGSVYKEVLKAAELAGTDLIVIGAHAPDLKDYLLGPNAARIVRHSTCSVHVVRIEAT